MQGGGRGAVRPAGGPSVLGDGRRVASGTDLGRGRRCLKLSAGGGLGKGCGRGACRAAGGPSDSGEARLASAGAIQERFRVFWCKSLAGR